MRESIGAAGCVVAGLVAVLVLGVAGAFASWGWRYYTAEIRGAVDAQEQIQSGSSRIANYNHFFNLCASIQANEAQLDALADELEGSTPGANQDRIRASITGVTAARGGAIAQYNADAQKNYTAGQFRDSDLPYQIPATPHQKGNRTRCAS